MNRNVESHFSRLPEVNIGRSMFDRSSRHLTSFNAGALVPLLVDECLPGDSVNITLSSVVRAQTLLAPIFDTAYLDTYAFFVPSRLLWSHFRDFCGENNESAWIPPTEYKMPTISSPEGGFATGTIADYMGIPVGVEFPADGDNSPIALPFRAYGLIVDQWFRDQNVQDPVNIPLGDASQEGSNGSDYVTDICNGGMPFIANKFHDYFTSGLPSAQKGTAVSIGSLVGSVNVHTGDTFDVTGNPPMSFIAPTFENSLSLEALNNSSSGGRLKTSYSNSLSSYNHPVGFDDGTNGSNVYHVNPIPNNLHADFTQASDVTVNALRLSFQLQKYYERLARSGSRYPEILLGQFGVVSPDASIQRPEYLGGTRIPLNVQQVSNTAQTNTDFLGDVGAMSVTSDVSDIIEKSFTEYGYLIVLGVVRYTHSYTQGLERFWTRHKYLDIYNPVFSNIGEQPIKQCELYATTDNLTTDHAFAFQEAWADYRYKPDRISGEFRPGIPNTLASWHLGDYYTEAPMLSSGWMQEDKTNVDRVLAVTSAVSNQFFGDFYFKAIWTRPMPMYSVPGLIDHN